MGVFNCSAEVTSSIPTAKAFEAIVDDKTWRSSPGSSYLSSRASIPAKAIGTGQYCYTIIEGNVLGTTLEKINFKMKITTSLDGGSVCKNTCTYFAKNDADIME
ncbi:major allergen Pru av 1-like [Eucalyptus grandis]|uniref:major allergen Pru av 1-like n=1 Tax=Eucalyptus grandis TaxID=71139 RepID=UPI00192E8617|nr:major allergen Pru av 1-like [Eucalyptus grandis]